MSDQKLIRCKESTQLPKLLILVFLTCNDSQKMRHSFFLISNKKNSIHYQEYEAEEKTPLFSLSRLFQGFYHVELSLCHEKKNQLP